MTCDRDMFGDSLLAARTRHGLSQLKAAKQCGLNQAIWSHWERGLFDMSTPRMTDLTRIETELGLIAGELTRHFGFLPADAPNLEHAAMGDERLTPSGRAALLAVIAELVSDDS